MPGSHQSAPEHADRLDLHHSHPSIYTVSTIAAMPWPPPMQAVASPRFSAAAPQLERQRQQQARAGHAERMAERDRAAVDVDLVAIEAELLLDGEILRGERLVDLDEIDVVERQAWPSSSTLRVAGAGPMPISVGSTPTVAQCVSRASGVRPCVFDAVRRREQQRRAAVDDAATRCRP